MKSQVQLQPLNVSQAPEWTNSTTPKPGSLAPLGKRQDSSSILSRSALMKSQTGGAGANANTNNAAAPHSRSKASSMGMNLSNSTTTLTNTNNNNNNKRQPASFVAPLQSPRIGEQYMQFPVNRSINEYISANSPNHNNTEQQWRTPVNGQQSQQNFAFDSNSASQQQQWNNQNTYYSGQRQSPNNTNYNSNNNNNNGMSSTTQFNLSFHSGDDLSQLKNTLNTLISKEEEIYKSLCARSEKLSDMVSMFGSAETFHFAKENDFTKFREAVSDLSNTLIQAARNEIELGARGREIERLSLDKKHAIRQQAALKEKNNELVKVIEQVQARNKALLEENSKLMILLNTEKKEKRISTKKVSALEKRVEFILENEVNVMLNPHDKLRQSLNELLRENESLKRDLTHKNQEIERNLGNLKRTNDIIHRLNSKIDSIKRDPSKYTDNSSANPGSGGGGSGGNSSGNGGGSGGIGAGDNPNDFLLAHSAQNQLKKNDDIDLFSNFLIPPNLDFRIVSLKADHQNLISDLIEVGSANFTKQIMTSPNQLAQRDAFNLIANQFLSCKELSEKVNLMLNEIQCIFNDSVELSESIPDANGTLARIFNAQSAHIWVVDCQSGILVTYENSSREKKCLISKGMIGESFFGKKPINSKNARNKPLLYFLTKDKEEPLIVDTCLLIPIMETKTNQVKLMVEVSNSKNELFSFDEEYLSIILGHYLNTFVSTRVKTKSQETIIKFNHQLIEELDFLMYAKDRSDLAQRVRTSISRCFGITNMLFYFVEGKNIVRYGIPSAPTAAPEKFSLTHGIVGQAVLDAKPYIITDIRQSSYYNKLVDLQSILPVFAIPLIDRDRLESHQEDNNNSNSSAVAEPDNNDGKPDEEGEFTPKTSPAVLAVLEIALKQKCRSTLPDMLIDGFLGHYGLEESLAVKVQSFSSIIVHAVKHLNRKLQK